MPRYKYEIQEGGKVHQGTISANSAVEASERLRDRGGQVLNVTEMAGAGAFLSNLRTMRLEFLPGLKDILYFTKQCAVMIRAGISIRDTVDSIAQQVENQRFQKILFQIRDDLESGTPFSGALAKHPKVFSRLYMNMVRASEMSGTFSDMMDRISEYLEEQAETRRMIRGAMIYPTVLFTISISATIFLLTWVLPRFMKIFEGKEEHLPKPTKLLMALSNFLQHQWYILVGAAVLAVVAFLVMRRTPGGRLLLDRLKLNFPILKKMFRAIYIARGLQTMGELVNAGVPVLETIEITAEVSGNILYRDMWLEVRDSVQEGNKIVLVLSQRDLMPRIVTQMVAAGEESGKLGMVLQDVADFYAKEMKDIIKAVTALLEPLMIVFMGFVVGFIAMSIILPVFKMSAIVTSG